MEYNRPIPVSLDQFKLGEKRIDVVSTLGAPTTNVKDGDNSCDIYQLFVRGPDRAGKAAVILGEAAADVFTLGLSEVAFTPAEAATRSHRHTILICYSPGEALVSLRDEGKEMRATQKTP